MKTTGAALTRHQQREVTTLATCLRATRTDGQVFGFTSHVSDLTVDGIVYVPGYSPTAVTTSSKLDVDNLDIMGLLDHAGITEADLLNGVWDYCRIDIFKVNYADVSQGTDGMRTGWLGEVKINRGGFVSELRGLMQALQQTIGELYSAGCRAKLGDARCKVNLAPYTFTGAVASAASNREFTIGDLGLPDGYFDYGELVWLGGPNMGLRQDVKTYAADVVVLQLPMPYDVAQGDLFRITAGCQKRIIEDCKIKFNNVPNFRGEPYVPGTDQVLKGPTRVVT